MTIFIELQQDLSTAILNYQQKKTEQGKTLSALRQNDIQAFQHVLTHAQTAHGNAVLLRQEVLDFIQTLTKHPLAETFPKFFGSALQQTIELVLNNPNYGLTGRRGLN